MCVDECRAGVFQAWKGIKCGRQPCWLGVLPFFDYSRNEETLFGEWSLSVVVVLSVELAR